MQPSQKQHSDEAFSKFRELYGLRACRKDADNDDEMIQMSVNDGLLTWIDGPSGTKMGLRPNIAAKPKNALLWAVLPNDVLYAAEKCEFGSSLQNGEIKHSNLTGGKDAHCAGELVFVSDNVIALNGCSGRYGPESLDEMSAVAKAFRNSGYGVWNYGYDEGTGEPFRFGAALPEWVE